MLGNRSMVRDLTGARLLLSLSDWSRHRSSINDNYYASSAASRQFSECLCDRQRGLFCKPCNQKQELCECDWRTLHRKPGLFYNLQGRTFKNFDCKFQCCKSCSFCVRVATKERRNSQLLSPLSRNKACARCFLCKSVEFNHSTETVILKMIY